MTTHAPGTQLSPLGRMLKRLRAQQDLTQEALAERVNCSVQTIRFFESGRRRPSWEMAELLADALNIPSTEREEFIRTARLSSAAAAAVESPDVVVAPPPAAAIRLPRPLTSMIGRAAECKLLESLLIDERRPLVTLVGPGGMGKTRLAQHVAHWLGVRFPDGAAFVSLSAIQHPSELPSAIARALGSTLVGDSDPLRQLESLLEAQRMLLVLDNFEHLLTGGEEQAIELLAHVVRGGSDVQLLVTSTERLRIGAESIVELGGLGTAPSRCEAHAQTEPTDAMMLYVERARQVLPDFALTPANFAAVERICMLLEGMPLGLELAASWARMLTPEEIAAEIAGSIDFLTLADRSAPVRHRSLRAVFDHTWRLMTSEEQRILPRLAVFSGGFERMAALEITGATLVQLAALIDKSVLRVTEEKRNDGAQSVRYSLHGLLRQFLLEKLEMIGELDAIQARHARYFTRYAERIMPSLYGKETAPLLRELNQEQANLTLALQWALAEGHDAEIGLRLAGALGRAWRLRGDWRQAVEWLGLALAQPVGTDAERARALVGMGECCHSLSDYVRAEHCLRQGLALWQKVGDSRWIAWTHFQTGMLASSQGDAAQASADLMASLDQYRTLNDVWGTSTVLNQLGAVAVVRGDYAAASKYLGEAIPMIRSLGQGRTGLAVSLNTLGRVVLAQGEVERAIGMFEEASAIFTQRNVREGVAWSSINLGLAWLAAGDMASAKGALHRCLDLYLELEMIIGITASLNALAAAFAAEHRYIDAGRIVGAVERLCREHDCYLTTYEAQLQADTVALVGQALGDADARTAADEGARLSVEQAVKLVLG